MLSSRYIHSNLKSKKIKLEEDQPLRYPYLKLLREYSVLKQEFEINPYVEVYQFRDNVYALFSESLDGMGDPWMYLIDGPEKAMLIDTAFGLGNLKGLIQKLIGDKELIVVNTHSHFDHAYGNAQFDEIYCSEYEVPRMRKTNNDKIWDYLFDDNGSGKWAEFDRKDIIPYHEYQIAGAENNHYFDLGGGYTIELIPLFGHTPGHSGYYDHVNHIIFTGDMNGITTADPDEPFAENCTVASLYRCLKNFQPQFAEVEGVFPGHGMLDIPAVILQNTLNTCKKILENPLNCDFKKTIIRPQNGESIVVMKKNINQGSAVSYHLGNVGEL